MFARGAFSPLQTARIVASERMMRARHGERNVEENGTFAGAAQRLVRKL
jgi:hypothetical protein